LIAGRERKDQAEKKDDSGPKPLEGCLLSPGRILPRTATAAAKQGGGRPGGELPARVCPGGGPAMVICGPGRRRAGSGRRNEFAEEVRRAEVRRKRSTAESAARQ